MLTEEQITALNTFVYEGEDWSISTSGCQGQFIIVSVLFLGIHDKTRSSKVLRKLIKSLHLEGSEDYTTFVNADTMPYGQAITQYQVFIPADKQQRDLVESRWADEN